MALRVDLTGEKFGRLLVIREDGRTHRKQVIWRCQCDCGNEKKVHTNNLRSGNTTSCGCLQKECASKMFKKHGLKGTPEYTSWQLMKDRCYNENNTTFKHYGGKGIKVCDEWINSPEKFVEDMGLKPTNLHTIDRIDSSKGYCKENCRWASKKEQARNRGITKIAIIDGVKKPLAEWSEIYGLNYRLVNERLLRGWVLIESLTTAKRVF